MERLTYEQFNRRCQALDDSEVLEVRTTEEWRSIPKGTLIKFAKYKDHFSSFRNDLPSNTAPYEYMFDTAWSTMWGRDGDCDEYKGLFEVESTASTAQSRIDAAIKELEAAKEALKREEEAEVDKKKDWRHAFDEYHSSNNMSLVKYCGADAIKITRCGNCTQFQILCAYVSTFNHGGFWYESEELHFVTKGFGSDAEATYSGAKKFIADFEAESD